MNRSCALVDMVFQHDIRLAVDLAAEAVLSVFRGSGDARFPDSQSGIDSGNIVTDGRNNPDSRYNNPTHQRSPSGFCRGGKADPHVFDGTHQFAIALHFAVRDAHLQAAVDDAGKIHCIFHHFVLRADHAG